jgi:hypothetical protein
MKDERLIEKFLSDKQHITIDDCDRLLINHDYELHIGGGSHRVYHKKGEIPLVIVAQKGTRYVKKIYIDRIVKYLHLE